MLGDYKEPWYAADYTLLVQHLLQLCIYTSVSLQLLLTYLVTAGSCLLMAQMLLASVYMTRSKA